jgi:hypothetical protein
MLKKQRNFLRLRHAKAHDDGTLKNPLFLKIKTPRWRIGAAVVAGLLAIVAASIGITHIPVLQLQSVAIHGTVTLDTQAIEQTIREYIAQKRLPLCSPTNVYFTRLDALESYVESQFPLQSVSVTREGQSLDASVVEKVTTVALRTKEKTAMLDVTGAFVRDATFEESRAIDIRIGSATVQTDELVIALQSDMPIVINTRNDSVTALSASSTAAFIALAEQLPINGMHALAFYIDGLDAPFVRVDTTEGYDVYVDIGLRSIEEQMQALHAVISADGFTAPNEYLDLRFGAYVYRK